MVENWFLVFFLMTKSICKGLYSCECDKMVLNIPKKVAMLRDIGLLGVMTFGLWEMLRRPLSWISALKSPFFANLPNADHLFKCVYDATKTNVFEMSLESFLLLAPTGALYVMVCCYTLRISGNFFYISSISDSLNDCNDLNDFNDLSWFPFVGAYLRSFSGPCLHH